MSRRDIKHSDPISVIGYNGRGHVKYPLKGYNNEHFTITCEYKRGWGSQKCCVFAGMRNQEHLKRRRFKHKTKRGTWHCWVDQIQL